MKNIIKLLKTNSFLWFQGQVITVIVGVWLFLYKNSYMDFKLYSFSLLVVFVLFFAMALHYILYRKLDLELTRMSLISFLLVVLTLCLYIKSFIIIYNGLPKPIYIQDLSLFSQYRYLLFSLGVIIAVILWFIGRFVINLPILYQKITYPYVKEEFRKILYCWHEFFMGDLCIFIYKKINKSKSFCFLYFMLHFIIFYIIRLITCAFLINFTFFGGDFRLVIYVLPFLCFTWVMSFFDYYFNDFREGTENYVKEMLHVTYDKKENDLFYISCDPQDLTFSLTAEGILAGFNDDQSLLHLVNKWFSCSDVAVKFKIYQFYVKYFKLFLMVMYPICWLTLAYKFLFTYNTLISFMVFPTIFRRPLMNHKIFHMRLPRDARYVKEGKPMNDVKEATKGAVSPGHPVIGEEFGNDYLIMFGLTKGDGKAPNLSEAIKGAPFKVIAIDGGPQFIDKSLVHTTPIKDTTAIVTRPDIEELLDKKVYKRVYTDHDTDHDS